MNYLLSEGRKHSSFTRETMCVLETGLQELRYTDFTCIVRPGDSVSSPSVLETTDLKGSSHINLQRREFS